MAEDIRTMHEEDEDEVKYCERKDYYFSVCHGRLQSIRSHQAC